MANVGWTCLKCMWFNDADADICDCCDMPREEGRSHELHKSAPLENAPDADLTEACEEAARIPAEPLLAQDDDSTVDARYIQSSDKSENSSADNQDCCQSKDLRNPHPRNQPAVSFESQQAIIFNLVNRQTEGEFMQHEDSDSWQRRWSNNEDAVSVISPTGSARCRFHPFLYRCFCQQNYRPRELIVIDTGDMTSSPSTFFTQGAPSRDPRVIYKHFRTKVEWSIGAKRNAACYFASGNVIVHFDDDDAYASSYISTMMSIMRTGEPPKINSTSHHILLGNTAGLSPPEKKDTTLTVSSYQEKPSHGEFCSDWFADAATLQVWMTYAARDPPRCGLVQTSLEKNRIHALGYGFSFAYLRSAWCQNPFGDINLGEDTTFFEGLLSLGARVALVSDFYGICAHVHHKSNFSGWEESTLIAQTALSQELVEAIRRLELELKMPTKVSEPMEISVQECLSALSEIICAFSSPECQAEFQKAGEKVSSNYEYGNAMRPILVKYQAPLMPKYGFEASLAGMVECHRAFTRPFILKDFQKGVSVYQFILHWLKNPHWQGRTMTENVTEFFGDWTGQASDANPLLRQSQGEILKKQQRVSTFVSHVMNVMENFGIRVPSQHCK